MTTTKLKLPELTASQSQKHVTHNEALFFLDNIVQLSVIDRDLATPPGSPALGDAYIVGGAPTGSWTGKTNQIAAYDGSGWIFFPPVEGWRAWVSDEDTLLVWSGAAWTFDKSTTEFPYLAPPTGEYILTTTTGGGSTSSVSGAAGRMEIFPFVPRRDVTIDRLALNVVTGVASATAKFVVYSSDDNGRPNELITETGDLDLSTTGTKEAVVNLTLHRGTVYWIGVRHSSTATISVWQTVSTADINGGSAISTTGRKTLRRTLTYATAAPTNWVFDSTEISSGNAPAIWLRAG